MADSVLLLMKPRPTTSTLSPYTTLFRSETADFQLDLLAGLEENFQDKQLADTLKEMGNVTKQIGTLKDAWQRGDDKAMNRSEEHTSELQSQFHIVCRLLLEKEN